jgi:hypothetical protein
VRMVLAPPDGRDLRKMTKVRLTETYAGFW